MLLYFFLDKEVQDSLNKDLLGFKHLVNGRQGMWLKDFWFWADGCPACSSLLNLGAQTLENKETQFYLLIIHRSSQEALW